MPTQNLGKASKDDRYPLKKLYRRIRHNHISKVLYSKLKSRASSKSFLRIQISPNPKVTREFREFEKKKSEKKLGRGSFYVLGPQ